MNDRGFKYCLRLALAASALGWVNIAIADLPETISRVRSSIVAIGIFKKTQSPPFQFRGTGFAVGDGTLIATNAHVIPDLPFKEGGELSVLVKSGKNEGAIRRVQLVNRDANHDLAILRMDGPPIPPIELDRNANIQEGHEIAFTGFPIGGALGFSHVTHRGIISSITSIAPPMGNSNQLSEKSVLRIRQGVFDIYQMDAVAYPGNSGSPVYAVDNGRVIGIVNMVFVKGSKESALTQPSGISYAVPVRFLTDLMSSSNISGTRN